LEMLHFFSALTAILPSCNLTQSGSCPNYGLFDKVIASDRSTRPSIYHSGAVSAILGNGSFSVTFDNYSNPTVPWFEPGLFALKMRYPSDLEVGLLVVAKIPGGSDYMQATVVASTGGPQWIVKFEDGVVDTIGNSDIVNVCSPSPEVPPMTDSCNITGGCVDAHGEPTTFSLNESVLVARYDTTLHYVGCYVQPRADVECGSGRNIQADMCYVAPRLPNDQTNALCSRMCSPSFAYSGTVWGTGCVCGNTYQNKVDDSMCSTPCAGDPNDWCGGPQNSSGRVFTSIYATPTVPYLPSQIVGIRSNGVYVSDDAQGLSFQFTGLSYWPYNSMFKNPQAKNAGSRGSKMHPLGEKVLAKFNWPFGSHNTTEAYFLGTISWKNEVNYSVWLDHGSYFAAGWASHVAVPFSDVQPLCYSY